MNDDIMTTQEAADYLKVHITTIRKLIQENSIDYTRVGRVIRIQKKDLIKYLDDNKNK